MTLLLFLSHYFLFAQLGIRFVHQKIIFAGLLTCAQIIFTEMALGLGGWLYLPWLVFVNGIITAMVFLYVYIFDKEGIVSFKVEGQSFFKGVKKSVSIEFGKIIIGFFNPCSTNSFARELLGLITTWHRL